ncbi:MAG: choice-of-anchor D domain-containing protein [Chloroflexi bacterium]|nr:choice-of-anchor D domain-containing protein [Chloroflexota bacterium]
MKTSFKTSLMTILILAALIVSGVGATPAYAAASFTANPTSWDAGTVNVGSYVDSVIFNITNTGDTLDGSKLQKIPSDQTNYRVVYSQCPWSWTNGTSCQVQVRFQPTTSGVKPATLSVYIPGAYSLDIPLTGAGAGPAVSINLTSWNFGDQAVGSASAAKSFTITNSGNQSLSIGTLAVSGEFALSGNTCNGATVAAAGTCTFGVKFSPTSTGTKSGSVSIPSNASTSPNSVSLAGNGVTQVQERVKNGGVNTYSGTSKVPANWVKNINFSSSDGKDTSTKKEGFASVKIVGAPGKSKTLKQTLNLSGVSGDQFTFTFWARGSAIPTAGVCKGQVMLYDGSVLKLTKTVGCKTGSYATFQKKTLSFSATSNYTKVVIMFTYNKASGTIWFDLVSLVK